MKTEKKFVKKAGLLLCIVLVVVPNIIVTVTAENMYGLTRETGETDEIPDGEPIGSRCCFITTRGKYRYTTQPPFIHGYGAVATLWMLPSSEPRTALVEVVGKVKLIYDSTIYTDTESHIISWQDRPKLDSYHMNTYGDWMANVDWVSIQMTLTVDGFPPVTRSKKVWGRNAGIGGFFSCFLAGSNVTMFNGSKKKIEDVQVGDLVMSYDTTNNKEIPGIVTKTLHHEPEEMAPYYLVINGNLRVTPNHGLFINGDWILAGDLQIGDTLGTLQTQVASIEKVFTKVQTYDLEVKPVPIRTGTTFLSFEGTTEGDGPFNLEGFRENSEQIYVPPPPSIPYIVEGVLAYKGFADNEASQ